MRRGDDLVGAQHRAESLSKTCVDDVLRRKKKKKKKRKKTQTQEPRATVRGGARGTHMTEAERAELVGGGKGVEAKERQDTHMNEAERAKRAELVGHT